MELNGGVDYQAAFAQISQGVTQLVTEPRGHAPPLPRQYKMDLYTLAFKICTNSADPRQKDLYEDVSALLVHHCKGFRQVLQHLAPEDLLPKYLRLFERFFTGMQHVADILNYLNRWWIKQQEAMPDFDAFATGIYPVELLPYVIWHADVYQPLREGLFGALMECVTRTREAGGASDEATFAQLRGIVDSYRQLDENLGRLPRDEDEPRRSEGRIASTFAAFEEGFIKHSVAHYTRKGEELAQGGQAACTEFMLAVERLLQQEAEAAGQWVPARCGAKCADCCLIALIYAQRELLVAAIPTLLRADNQDDLRRLYRLIKPVQGLPLLCDALQQHVEQSGGELLQRLELSAGRAKGRGRDGAALKDPRGYAEGLWRLHSRAQAVVSYCCEADESCAAAVRSALRTVVNSAPRSAEALARFVNSVLSGERKGGGRRRASAEAEPEPDSAAGGREEGQGESGKVQMAGDLVAYLDDKDVFMQYTARLMAKRLIQGSASLENEEELLLLVRPSCGQDFAARLQRMCTDCKLVPELGERFQGWREQQAAQAPQDGGGSMHSYANPMLPTTASMQPRDGAAGGGAGEEAREPVAVGDVVLQESGAAGDRPAERAAAPPVDERVSFEMLCLTAGAWPVGAQPAKQPPAQVSEAPDAGGSDATAMVRAATPESAPPAPGAVFVLPAVLERWRHCFETFYTESFSGRKLSWLHHLSKVELSFGPQPIPAPAAPACAATIVVGSEYAYRGDCGRSDGRGGGVAVGGADRNPAASGAAAALQ